MGSDIKKEMIIERYDDIMYQPVFLEYYGYSNFSNFGYWDEHIMDQKGACEKLMETLLQLLPDKKGRILDVACGKGGTTEYLLNYFKAAEIYAMNISGKQVKSAQSFVPDCTFSQMGATHLAFKDESFHKLMCVEAAFHFETRADFFAEAYRVLKPGGCLLLSDMLMAKEAEENLPFHTVKNYVKDPDAYRELCKQAGFIDAKILDVTKECWHGLFWNIVRQSHEKFLKQQIDQAALNAYLEKTYRMVGEIKYYLLAVAHKASN